MILIQQYVSLCNTNEAWGGKKRDKRSVNHSGTFGITIFNLFSNIKGQRKRKNKQFPFMLEDIALRQAEQI